MEQEFAFNCSLALGPLRLEERLKLVSGRGFPSIELWWPFGVAKPSDDEVDRLIETISSSGLRLVVMNLFAGDMGAGERGVLSHPDRRTELLDSARVAARVGAALGVRRFNALYGLRIPGMGQQEQRSSARTALSELSEVFADIDGQVLIEPLSGVSAYPVKTTADAMCVIEDSGLEPGSEIAFLLDVYHLAANGDDVSAAIAQHADSVIGHVQLADSPGRGIPGSGDLPIRDWLDRLRRRGYAGEIALECLSDLGDTDAKVFADWKERV